MNEEEINVNKKFIERVKAGDFYEVRRLLSGKDFINGVDVNANLAFKANVNFAADEAYYLACELGHLKIIKYFLTGEFNIEDKIIKDDINLIIFKDNENNLGLVSAYASKQDEVINYLKTFINKDVNVLTLIKHGSPADVMQYYEKTVSLNKKEETPVFISKLLNLIFYHKRHDLYESLILKNKLYENVLFDNIEPNTIGYFLEKMNNEKAVDFIVLFKDKLNERHMAGVFISMCQKDTLEGIKLLDKLQQFDYKNGIVHILEKGSLETLKYVVEKIDSPLKISYRWNIELSKRESDYIDKAMSIFFNKDFYLESREVQDSIEKGTFKKLIEDNGLSIVNAQDYESIMSSLLEKESNLSKVLEFSKLFNAKLNDSHIEKVIKNYICATELTYSNMDDFISNYKTEIKNIFKSQEDEISDFIIYFYKEERFDKLYMLFDESVLIKKAFKSDEISAKKFFKDCYNSNIINYSRKNLTKEFLSIKKEIEDKVESVHLVSYLRTNLAEKAEKSKSIKI